MNLFSLSGIFTGIVSSIFGIFVYLKNRKNKINQVFLFFALAVATWGFGVYKIGLAENSSDGIFWWRTAYIGVIFIPIFLLHFTYLFLEIKTKKLIRLAYLAGFFYLLIDYTNLFMRDIRLEFSSIYYIRSSGFFYPLFAFFWFATVIYAHYKLFEAIKSSSKVKSTQIKYFFLAMAVGFAGGATCFLPIFNINIYPILNFTVALYPVIMAYAITKHHLMDIKIVTTEALASFISFVLLVDALLSKSSGEFFLKLFIFLGASFLGALLIRGVLREIETKDKIKGLADNLSKTNKQLRSANRELKRLDGAKSEFLSIASHQLRTPLSAIKGLSSMMLDGDFGQMLSEQKDTVNKIFFSSERLNKLIESLLNISRIESDRLKLNFEEKSLEIIVKDVVDELAPVAGQKGLIITFEPQNYLPKVYVDPEKIREVIMNLIDNSIKYTDKGIIEAGLQVADYNEIKPKVKNSCQYEFNKHFLPENGAGKFICFNVKDNGRGVLKDDQYHLFQKFTRGKGMFVVHTEGTGLGLYVCRKIIEAHKGLLWVESEGEGKGSRFYFALKAV